MKKNTPFYKILAMVLAIILFATMSYTTAYASDGEITVKINPTSVLRYVKNTKTKTSSKKMSTNAMNKGSNLVLFEGADYQIEPGVFATRILTAYIRIDRQSLKDSDNVYLQMVYWNYKKDKKGNNERVYKYVNISKIARERGIKWRNYENLTIGITTMVEQMHMIVNPAYKELVILLPFSQYFGERSSKTRIREQDFDGHGFLFLQTALKRGNKLYSTNPVNAKNQPTAKLDTNFIRWNSITAKCQVAQNRIPTRY